MGAFDEKQVIDRLRGPEPFREAIGTPGHGGLVETSLYRGFYVRSFSDEMADLYELYKGRMFRGELAVQMSDRDIRRL